MKRALALLAAGFVLVPTSASAAERSLLVNGDSLAEGTRPYITPELAGWRVRQSTAVSRHAAEADVGTSTKPAARSARARFIHPPGRGSPLPWRRG